MWIRANVDVRRRPTCAKNVAPLTTLEDQHLLVIDVKDSKKSYNDCCAVKDEMVSEALKPKESRRSEKGFRNDK